MAPADPARARNPARRSVLLAIGVLVALILVPFLFWRGNWFGRPLTDRQIDQYLHDETRPRHIQHALAQISQRLGRGDSTASRWYPRIAALAGHKIPELRVTAAWLMGQDHRSDQFHRTLSGLLEDPEPLVRRNAALSLARFGDPAGRAELRAMLRPLVVRAPGGGALRYRLKAEDRVDQGSLIARLERPAGEPVDLRSPLPGRFQSLIAAEGATVRQGQEILLLEPSADHVWEALRALLLVGTDEDLEDVSNFTRPRAGWRSEIAEQASRTAGTIRSRAGR